MNTLSSYTDDPDSKQVAESDTPPASTASQNSSNNSTGIGQQSTNYEFEKPTVADGFDPDQITHYEPKGLEKWVAEREEHDDPYAIFNLTLHRYADLTTNAQWLDATTRTTHNNGVGNTRVCPGMSGGSPNEETLVERVVSWHIDLMAVPYYETARPIPSDNIRIFAAEDAIAALSEAGVELSPVIQKLQSIPEHSPSDDYIELLDEYHKLTEQTRSDSELVTSIRDIENTVRAKFGFNRKYGGPTPDPHEEYEHCTVGQLKSELDNTRRELEQKKTRVDEVSSALTELENDWKSETRQSLFSNI